MKTILAAIFAAALFSSLAAAQPAFTQKPTAVKSGDAIQIDFAVERETDVVVTIENARGKIIRHLAAGVLGKNPPEPLQANKLAQSFVWDGKDDFGKAATGGPFTVRVQLGMKPEFDRFLAHNPHAGGPISSVAVGPGGTLYVFHRDGTVNGNMGGHKIKVYSRDGKHLKVVAPFPADIAPEKLKALGVFQTKEGDLVPHMFNWETLSFYPDKDGVRGRDMPELTCPAVDSRGRVYWLVKGPFLVAIDADGGIPYDTFLGPKLLPEIKELRLAGETYHYWSERPSLAVSSDDKYVYFAGLSAGFGDYKKAKPLPCVFRVDADKRGPAEVFLGKLTPSPQPLSPKGEKGSELIAPRGLAVAKGLIYVADPAADRVAAFKETDGAYVGEIAVKNPQVVGFDPATGAVYVCAYTGPMTADLIKFNRLGGKESFRIKLPRTGHSPNAGVHRIAVDASARPVRIWMPQVAGNIRLHCFEDAGDEFIDKGDPRPKDFWIEGPRDIAVDRVRGEVYVEGNGNITYRLDDDTGEIKDVIDLHKVHPGTVLAAQLVPGQDDSLYVFTWNNGLWRLDRKGKPKNWDGLDTYKIPIEGMMNFQMRYLALKPYAPADEVYLIANANYLTKNPKDAGRFLTLNAIGQDGKTKRTLIWQCLNGAIPRLDSKGNIYIADLVKPIDRSYPEFFDGKLPPPPKQTGGGDLFWYSYMYGSIIKFPPEGGIIWHHKDLPKSALGEPPAELLAKPKIPFKRHYAFSPHLTGEIQGALWTRFGYSPYSSHMSGNTSHCMCEGSGFDVDSFGRVFYPNLGQFRIEVIDTNNNPITAFGKYGNEDSGGPEAKIKSPAIPLAWPTYVAVSDRFAYVADTVNRRVVRVRLGYAAEATCGVP